MDTKASYTFKLIGRENGMFLLRAPTWNTTRRNGLDAHRFQNEVFAWLMEEADGKWHLGNGNAAGYPELPQAFSTGTGLCILIERLADVVRFANAFKVTDLAVLDRVVEMT